MVSFTHLKILIDFHTSHDHQFTLNMYHFRTHKRLMLVMNLYFIHPDTYSSLQLESWVPLHVGSIAYSPHRSAC